MSCRAALFRTSDALMLLDQLRGEGACPSKECGADPPSRGAAPQGRAGRPISKGRASVAVIFPQVRGPKRIDIPVIGQKPAFDWSPAGEGQDSAGDIYLFKLHLRGDKASETSAA